MNRNFEGGLAENQPQHDLVVGRQAQDVGDDLFSLIAPGGLSFLNVVGHEISPLVSLSVGFSQRRTGGRISFLFSLWLSTAQKPGGLPAPRRSTSAQQTEPYFAPPGGLLS